MMRRRSRLDTRELILLCFFAAFLVASRAALRWHLHIPGHAMLPAAFGLVLVRVCVGRRSAATLCGVLAGSAVAALGMGRGGPLLLLKLALPGAVVDLGALLGGGNRDRLRPIRPAMGLALGAAAGASSIGPMVLIEWLAGVDPAVIWLHGAGAGVARVAFGALGGAAAAWVGGELAHHGLLGQPDEVCEAG